MNECVQVLGCILLSVSIYSLYHEWSLPISQAEGRVLRALGVLSFGMALLGLYRAHALTDEEALAAGQWQYLHSANGKGHAGELGGSGSGGGGVISRKKTAARARRHSRTCAARHQAGVAANQALIVCLSVLLFAEC